MSEYVAHSHFDDDVSLLRTRNINKMLITVELGSAMCVIIYLRATHTTILRADIQKKHQSQYNMHISTVNLGALSIDANWPLGSLHHLYYQKSSQSLKSQKLDFFS